MILDLLDIDKFIELNNISEVTSPVLFQKGGIPDPRGLVSNEIFGINVYDRKSNFAYISLNRNFLHPHAYKVMKRIFRNIEGVIAGTEYFSISDEGELVKDPNGETGLDFLYDNWEKIKWKKSDGGQRNERIDLLTMPKNIIFVRKQLVIPAFYRDVSYNDNGGGNTIEVNTFYTKLIRLSSLLDSAGMFDFSFNSTLLAVQNCLVDIYDYFKSKVGGKSGLMRKFLLGKNTDYGVRSVICAPTFHSESIDDSMIDFRHAAVPLSQMCVLFYPFMMHWLTNFFKTEIVERSAEYPILDKHTLDIIRTSKIKNAESAFDDRYCKRLMDIYIKHPDARFDTIPITLEDGKKLKLYFKGRAIYNEDGQSTNRTDPVTITDLLFLAACDIGNNKHVMVTRYPVLDSFGIFFNKVRVASTIKTESRTINGIEYKWYPVIEKVDRNQVGTRFVDTFKFSNAYLTGIGGDYDGDQVTIKGIYSLEANESADNILTNKSTVLSINGSNMRKCDCEVIQTLYVLTKNA